VAEVPTAEQPSKLHAAGAARVDAWPTAEHPSKLHAAGRRVCQAAEHRGSAPGPVSVLLKF